MFKSRTSCLETVKSFVFMHIPFKEFADAKDALDAGEQDAVYLFGENGEKTCFPEHNSGFFDVILDKNSTDAVFVGHDHLNNIGIKYKGVDLVCSKSIDYIAYPEISQMTEQRGATLITILQNGEYRIKQVNYNKWCQNAEAKYPEYKSQVYAKGILRSQTPKAGYLPERKFGIRIKFFLVFAHKGNIKGKYIKFEHL